PFKIVCPRLTTFAAIPTLLVGTNVGRKGALYAAQSVVSRKGKDGRARHASRRRGPVSASHSRRGWCNQPLVALPLRVSRDAQGAAGGARRTPRRAARGGSQEGSRSPRA